MWVAQPCGADRDLLLMMCQDRLYAEVCKTNIWVQRDEWLGMVCDMRVGEGCRGTIEAVCDQQKGQ